MVNISNRNGRALEYRIVRELINRMPIGRINLSPRAQHDQLRDEENYLQLPENLQNSFSSCASTVFTWLNDEFLIVGQTILVDRLSDHDAQRGDVTDIAITTRDDLINLSIKHNHTALKHQRPPTTAQWCGYPQGSQEDLNFRKFYGNIINTFIARARQDFPTAVYFRDIKEQHDNYINDLLYMPVCMHVNDFINNYANNPNAVQRLFNFLIGNVNYYKIIDCNDRVVIFNFTDIIIPQLVTASCRNSNYIDLIFSNGWLISMRLHTAASNIGRSLKFDTRLSNINELMPHETIMKAT